jgi:ubiquinone/menaquinone biosynthesis C-methylase UbiE
MSASSDPPDRENIYFIDPESGAEMARLLDQDRLVTRGLGGLFSGLSDAEVTRIQRILDIACGPGGWAQEVAFAYPGKEVVGFDISQAMIEYARAQARLQKLHNATFHVMNALEPLTFPAESFDLVNARSIVFLPPAAWPGLLKECLRVLKPGGIIRLSEGDIPFTNKPAYDTIWRWLSQALHKARQTFSPNGQQLGIVPMLGYLVRQAGFQDIRQIPHVLDASLETESYESARQDTLIATRLFQPFVTAMGIATQEEFNRAYEQMQVEMMADDFRSLAIMLTVIGTKP